MKKKSGCRFTPLLRWSAIAVAFFVLFQIYEGRALSAEQYDFAVVPQFEQRKLFAIWKPVVDELRKRTGIPLRLVATLTISEFERDFRAGKFDFVYTNPYHVMKEITRQGYIPLVRDKAPLRGIIVVRRDSPFRNVRALQGKRLAFPSPNAVGACMLIRADLSRLYDVTVQPIYAKTHSSVYLHVVNGLADAGGGVEKTLAEQDPGIRDSLSVIYTTREMPSHPVAAHPRVPREVREKVRQAFLGMASTAEGRDMLGKIPMKDPVSASPADYTVMKDWGLEKYWKEE